MVDESGAPEAAPRSDGEPQDLLAGLTNLRGLGLGRWPIRTRSSSVTRAAWRMTAVCDQGEGAVMLVEDSSEETFYRGDGIFLGWPQQRLAFAYLALAPRDDEPPLELHQLG